MGLLDNLFEPSGLMGTGGTQMDALNRQIMWNRIGAMGASLMQGAQPQHGPTPIPQQNPLGNAAQAFMDPNNMVGPIQQASLMGQLNKMDKESRAQESVAKMLQSPEGDPTRLARARALFAAGDMHGAVKALYPEDQKPTTTGGLQYDPATKQWMPIPGYVEQQERIRRAGKTTVNVNTGTQTEIGKLLADKEALLARGVKPDSPVIQGIDRKIENYGVPSGETARYQEMVASGKRTVETLTNELMPGGKVDMNKVRNMWANLPFAEGRTTRAQFRDAAAMLLRFETGAQANEQEIQNMLDRYMPSILDNEETVRDKLTRFRQRFEGATRGKSDPKKALKEKYGLE